MRKLLNFKFYSKNDISDFRKFKENLGVYIYKEDVLPYVKESDFVEISYVFEKDKMGVSLIKGVAKVLDFDQRNILKIIPIRSYLDLTLMKYFEEGKRNVGSWKNTIADEFLKDLSWLPITNEEIINESSDYSIKHTMLDSFLNLGVNDYLRKKEIGEFVLNDLYDHTDKINSESLLIIDTIIQDDISISDYAQELLDKEFCFSKNPQYKAFDKMFINFLMNNIDTEGSSFQNKVFDVIKKFNSLHDKQKIKTIVKFSIGVAYNLTQILGKDIYVNEPLLCQLDSNTLQRMKDIYIVEKEMMYDNTCFSPDNIQGYLIQNLNYLDFFATKTQSSLSFDDYVKITQNKELTIKSFFCQQNIINVLIKNSRNDVPENFIVEKIKDSYSKYINAYDRIINIIKDIKMISKKDNDYEFFIEATANKYLDNLANFIRKNKNNQDSSEELYLGDLKSDKFKAPSFDVFKIYCSLFNPINFFKVVTKRFDSSELSQGNVRNELIMKKIAYLNNLLINFNYYKKGLAKELLNYKFNNAEILSALKKLDLKERNFNFLVKKMDIESFCKETFFEIYKMNNDQGYITFKEKLQYSGLKFLYIISEFFKLDNVETKLIKIEHLILTTNEKTIKRLEEIIRNPKKRRDDVDVFLEFLFQEVDFKEIQEVSSTFCLDVAKNTIKAFSEEIKKDPEKFIKEAQKTAGLMYSNKIGHVMKSAGVFGVLAITSFSSGLNKTISEYVKRNEFTPELKNIVAKNFDSLRNEVVLNKVNLNLEKIRQNTDYKNELLPHFDGDNINKVVNMFVSTTEAESNDKGRERDE